MQSGSILITGGTGFLGRALVRRLLRDNLSSRVCIYSRGEHAQANMRAEVDDDPRCRWFIGDVRDARRLRRAMNDNEVVVHAAALKRIEVAAYNPTEVARTNVDGAYNVIEAAQDAGVRKAVFISTDKAWRPINAYGASKLLAESMFIASNRTGGPRGTRFSVCRYGNIFGSNGSIVPKWRAIIAAGEKKVPVTDPDATRFFMKIEEAVELVLDTIATMQGGEVSIPRLPAYRVGDLAEALDVDMDIIGLPDFEKLHEGMADGLISDIARRMSVEELKQELDLLPDIMAAAYLGALKQLEKRQRRIS